MNCSKIKLNLFLLFFIPFFSISSFSCSENGELETKNTEEPENENPIVQVLDSVSVTIDLETTFQTVEGFGFFGAKDVWWGNSDNMWDDSWGEKVISDLGITIWRNEMYPPGTSVANQDANWGKQLPVVKGLKEKADKYKVDLKFISTVWSPPAELKWECNMTWAGDENASRNEGNVSTKNGGTLNPNKYKEYANWLNSNIQQYKEAGVDLYALSLQNEPLFAQSFNSCTYTVSWYNDLLVAVTPKVKELYPGIKIFGAENMLEMEGEDENYQWFYHSAIKANTEASQNIDILAVHGYSDGVAATSGSELAKMWANHKTKLSTPMNKQAWMTETSGYTEDWTKTGDKPGALNLAMDIHSALVYGNASAWLWWQGSQGGDIGEYNLMNGTSTGKKYHVSKHFYRYIRPGAVRVKSEANDETIFVSAFKNVAKATTTIAIINAGNEDKTISLIGENLPESYKMFRTNSNSENCEFIEEVRAGKANKFVLPAKCIITLHSGEEML